MLTHQLTGILLGKLAFGITSLMELIFLLALLSSTILLMWMILHWPMLLSAFPLIPMVRIGILVCWNWPVIATQMQLKTFISVVSTLRVGILPPACLVQMAPQAVAHPQLSWPLRQLQLPLVPPLHPQQQFLQPHQ